MKTRRRFPERFKWRMNDRLPGQRLKRKKWIVTLIVLTAAFDWFLIVFGIEVILPYVLDMAPPYLPQKYAQAYTHISTLKGYIGLHNPVLAFSPDSKIIATSGHQEVRLWDVETGAHLLTLEMDMNQIRTLAFQADGKRVVGVGEHTLSHGSYQFMEWDLTAPDLKLSESERDTFRGETRNPRISEDTLVPQTNTSRNTAIFSENRTNAISLGHSGSMWVLNNTLDQVLYHQVIGKKALNRMQLATFHFSTDPTDEISTRWCWGKHHYIPTPGPIVLNKQDTRSLSFLTAPKHYVMALTFSPDGKTLASGGYSYRLNVQSWNQLWDIPIGEIRLWDVDTCRQIAFMQASAGRVSNLAFSSDGKTLASGMSWWNTILIWDVPNRHLLSVLTGHKADITTMVFAPDSITLASVDDDGMVHLWDITGRTKRGK